MERILDTLIIDVVRHGQSQENVNKEAFRNAATDTVGLTGKGRYQGLRAGKLIGRRFEAENVGRAIMLKSPMIRTSDTGTVIAEAIGSRTEIIVGVDPNLREIRLMDRKIEARLAPIHPGQGLFGRRLMGETRSELENRVSAIGNKIQAMSIETGIRNFVVSGHNTMIRCFVAKTILGLSIDNVDGFAKLGNAHVWRCHGGRVEAIHPEIRLVAERNAFDVNLGRPGAANRAPYTPGF